MLQQQLLPKEKAPTDYESPNLSPSGMGENKIRLQTWFLQDETVFKNLI